MSNRFKGKAQNYQQYRPHYPQNIIDILKEKFSFTNQWIVADVGSGTGISSELFVKNGNVVIGIEPNQEMKSVAETFFKNQKNFISLEGTAERTTLPDNSVDLIVAGQAFHWFKPRKAKIEFKRILTTKGYVLLLWNQRNKQSPIQEAYHQMLLEYAPKYTKVCQDNVDETSIKRFFSNNCYFQQSIPHSQFFNFEGLLGRLLSTSYAPTKLAKNHPLMIRLKQIFEEFNKNGIVEFPYQCEIYCGQIN